MSTVYDILRILPLSLLLLMLCGDQAAIPEDSFLPYGIGTIVTLLLILLRNSKRKLLVSGITVCFLGGVWLAMGEDYRQLCIEEYFYVLWIVCFSAGALLIGILTDRSIWLKRITASALLGYSIAGTALNWEIPKAAFALICLLLLIQIAEEIQRRWHKSGYPEPKEHITRLALVFLTAVLLVYAVPAPAEPYDWQFAKDIYAFTSTQVSRLYGILSHPSEEYGQIGFSENGGFFAGIGSSDDEVLYITAGNTKIRDLRLVGCISGEFTGTEWIFDTETASDSRMLDTLETACAVRKYAGLSRSDYLQKLDMHCRILLHNTRYVFSPAKIKLEATRKNAPGILEQNGSIVSKKKLHYQDELLVSSYVLNDGNPHLAELLTDAAPLTAAEWEQTAIAEGVLDRNSYTFAEYEQYRRDVYAQYCNPCDVSDDVQAILDGIQCTSSTRYEALKQLEAYFHDMTYDTNCGALPSSVHDAESFLDYFLFDAKKGYCMHYATSFTLMANAMGIPCRYVQGYHVQRDAEGNALVLQAHAHAWPEAYFDNVGWVAFEPTPGHAVSSGWRTAEYNPEPLQREEPEPATEEPEPTDEPQEEPEASAPDPLLFIVPAAAVLGFLLLAFLVGRLLARSQYRRMSTPDKFRHLTQQDLRLLGYLGFPMEEGETLAEFEQRVQQSDR
ncbi:MAG: transglutaminase domain-containing protein, partial [Oscillospiraceae bacterium]|nr:transglutaminase domain-containing protein [Oscillospiraceae bacterium]